MESEALANVVRHAQVSRAAVTLQLGDEAVVLEHRDGRGGAMLPRGLRGLADRVDTFGGTLRPEQSCGRAQQRYASGRRSRPSMTLRASARRSRCGPPAYHARPLQRLSGADSSCPRTIATADAGDSDIPSVPPRRLRRQPACAVSSAHAADVSDVRTRGRPHAGDAPAWEPTRRVDSRRCPGGGHRWPRRDPMAASHESRYLALCTARRLSCQRRGPTTQNAQRERHRRAGSNGTPLLTGKGCRSGELLVRIP